MSFTITLEHRSSKDPQEVRAVGFVPAIMYGPDMESVSLQLGSMVFEKLYNDAGTSSLIDCTIEGQAEPIKALIQDVQYDPVSRAIIHVDFRQIPMGKEMFVSIPLEFIGESNAVKSLGGTLSIALEEVEAKCLPKHLVSHINVDLSALKSFDDGIDLKDLIVPEGITLLEEGTTPIAHVTQPMSEEKLKEMDAAVLPVDVATVEVEKKGKKEEEGDAGEKEEKKGDKKEEKK